MSDSISYSRLAQELTSQDSFGRQRISNPTTIFDSKQIVDTQALFWDDQQTSGSGTTSTFNTNQASTTLAVSNATAGTRVRQTFRRFNYQPGKMQQTFMTGVLGTGGTGIIKRVGIFDTNNGLFFEQNGTTLSVVVRTKTSGTVVDISRPQSSWNLDKLDGTGSSGLTLDVAKTQIFIIEFEWLGVGTTKFGFKINGKIYYVHEIHNANSLSLVYMSTPNLPLRYEISNSGSGSANSLVHICSSVISEGGSEKTGFPLSVDRGASGLTTANDTSIYPLLAIQLKSGYEGATIDIASLSIICTSTAAYRWCLLLNPTVTGTALSFSSVTNSAIQVDVSRGNTTTVSGGIQIDSGYAQNTSEGSTDVKFQNKLTIGSNIAGTNDILVLGIQRITGTSETFFGALTWNETI